MSATPPPLPLPYETPAPAAPRRRVSKTCVAALAWALVTSPIVTFVPADMIVRRGGPVGLFVATSPWLRYFVFMGLPMLGIFIAVKGVTDLKNDPRRRGRALGLAAIGIDVISIMIGASMAETV